MRTILLMLSPGLTFVLSMACLRLVGQLIITDGRRKPRERRCRLYRDALVMISSTKTIPEKTNISYKEFIDNFEF